MLTALALIWLISRADGRASGWPGRRTSGGSRSSSCSAPRPGGAESPFALLYFFAIGHAAAFQPRGRFVITSVIGLIAFLAPLIYSNVVGTNFAAIACVGGVLALLTTVAVHLALERMRADRRRLELLIAATAKLDTSLDPQQTLRRIAGTALPELAELCVIDLVDEDDTITTDRRGRRRSRGRRARRTDASGPAPAAPRRPSGRARPAGRTPMSSRTSPSARRRSARDDPDGRRAAGWRRHVRSATVVPMVARGRLLGVMSFVHAGRPQRGQLRVLEDLTGRAALAFDNARLYAERARVAQTLRRSLMPEALPAVPGLDLECFFRPMGAAAKSAATSTTSSRTATAAGSSSATSAARAPRQPS